MSFAKLNMIGLILCTFIMKSLSQCDTEASSSTECFALGCCWNGFNGCGDCSTLCPSQIGGLLNACSNFGCCPTILNGVPQAQCQTPPAVSSQGPQCCIADGSTCSQDSIDTGLCCNCANGPDVCGMNINT